METCSCELRHRRWNPNTGVCETCRTKYHKHSLLDPTEPVPARELVEQLAAQILVRKGEVITEELAFERARNIATGLIGTLVTG